MELQLDERIRAPHDVDEGQGAELAALRQLLIN